MPQRDKFSNLVSSITESGHHNRAQCLRLIESEVREHPKGQEALDVLQSRGFDRAALIDCLEAAAHPSAAQERARRSNVLRQLKKTKPVLLKAADTLDEIRSDPTMQAGATAYGLPSLMMLENGLRHWANYVGQHREGVEEALIRTGTESYRWGELAIRIRIVTYRQPPWKHVATLLECACRAHGLDIDISDNAACQAEKHLRKDHPEIYWPLFMILTKCIRGMDAALPQGMEDVIHLEFGPVVR